MFLIKATKLFDYPFKAVIPNLYLPFDEAFKLRISSVHKWPLNEGKGKTTFCKIESKMVVSSTWGQS